jgi:hypothetical protein
MPDKRRTSSRSFPSSLKQAAMTGGSSFPASLTIGITLWRGTSIPWEGSDYRTIS